jgi:ribonuclease P protein component
VPKYSHSAADRNRVKRRLREIVRLEVLPALPNVDVVVRALPSAYTAAVAELREQCVRACGRIQGAA